MLDLAGALLDDPERRYRPWVLLPKAEGPLAAELVRRGIRSEVLALPVDWIGMSRSRPLEALGRGARSSAAVVAYVARLASRVRRSRSQILQSNGLKCHALAALAAPAAGAKVLWHMRDILQPGPWHETLRGLARLPWVRVVANSRATAEALGLSPAHSPFVVYNGFCPSAWKPVPNRRWGEGKPVVGIVGVLARWKGQLEFLAVAKKLVESGVDARFVVIGGEIYDTGSDQGFGLELEREAERLGIRNRVQFAGFVTDPIEAVNGLDVLVHASTRPEPFGRVVVEAMACGVPVVASRAGGIPELVRDRESALLCPPGDVTAIAEAVGRLLGNPQLRTDLIENARREFLCRFTLDRHTRAIQSVYDAVISGKKRDSDQEAMLVS